MGGPWDRGAESALGEAEGGRWIPTGCEGNAALDRSLLTLKLQIGGVGRLRRGRVYGESSERFDDNATRRDSGISKDDQWILRVRRSGRFSATGDGIVGDLCESLRQIGFRAGSCRAIAGRVDRGHGGHLELRGSCKRVEFVDSSSS